MNDVVKSFLASMKLLKKFFPVIRLLSLGIFIGISWQVIQHEKATMRADIDRIDATVRENMTNILDERIILIRIDENVKLFGHRLERLEDKK